MIICWISGFFFPQAFLTATLQNNARKSRTAIDRLAFTFTVESDGDVDGNGYTIKPEGGCRIYGLFIEGCKWDTKLEKPMTSDPKVLFAQVPPILMIPIPEKPTPVGTYLCPIYKTLSRRGVLSTTGHSTNFVMYLDLRADNASLWVVAGVACFLALRSN